MNPKLLKNDSNKYCQILREMIHSDPNIKSHLKIMEEKSHHRIKTMYADNVASLKQFFTLAGFEEFEYDEYLTTLLEYSKKVIKKVLRSLYTAEYGEKSEIEGDS